MGLLVVLFIYNVFMKIMISSCLLGINTRYDGKLIPINPLLKKFLNNIIIPFCPEQFGLLKTPRSKSTLSSNSKSIVCGNGCVINDNGKNVSSYFLKGAKTSLGLIQDIKPDLIILKENSPSCGLRFTNINWQKKRGMGITTYLIKNNTNIKCISF